MTIRLRTTTFLSGVAALSLAAGANAQFINGSFEDPPQSFGNYTTDGINGWSTDLSQGPAGVWNPYAFSQAAPDGIQIGYTNAGPVAQQSTVGLGLGENTLTAFFGNRNDGFNGVGTLELWAGGSVSNGSVTGGTLLASTVVDETLIGSGTYQGFTASYNASGADPLLGELLTARITMAGGTQMDFDAVSLQAAPEPASLAAIGLGLLVMVRRRKSQA